MNSLITGVIEQKVWKAPPVVVYTVSLDPTSYNFTTAGETVNVTTVTCTMDGAPYSFTAEITTDSQSIIESLNTSGGDSGSVISVTIITNSAQHTDCASATITVICGTETAELGISQDGTVFGC